MSGMPGRARHEGNVPLGTRKRVGGAHGAMDSGAVTRPVLGNLAARSRSECEYRYGDESADDGGSDQTMPARPPPAGVPLCAHQCAAPPSLMGRSTLLTQPVGSFNRK